MHKPCKLVSSRFPRHIYISRSGLLYSIKLFFLPLSREDLNPTTTISKTHFFITMKIQPSVTLLLATAVTQVYGLPKRGSSEDRQNSYDVYMVRLLTAVFDYYLHLEF